MDTDYLMEKFENRQPTVLNGKTYRSYGILVPVIPKGNELHILFEVRSLQLRQQPGEVCFPGGRVEHEDRNPKSAALRETSEELGISTDRITRVYPLDYLVQPVEGRMIYPYVGLMDSDVNVVPNKREVKEIFTVPLTYLIQTEPETYTIGFKPIPEERFPFHLIPGGKDYPWQKRRMKELFYFYGEYVIWGLTANILSNFLSIVKGEGDQHE